MKVLPVDHIKCLPVPRELTLSERNLPSFASSKMYIPFAATISERVVTCRYNLQKRDLTEDFTQAKFKIDSPLYACIGLLSTKDFS